MTGNSTTGPARIPWPARYPAPGLRRPDTADLSANFAFAYDDANFYSSAVITDNVHVQTARTRGLELWKGDDVELWFDTNLPGDFTLDPPMRERCKTTVQLGLSPGDFAAQLGPESIFFVPKGVECAKLGVRVAAAPRRAGRATRWRWPCPGARSRRGRPRGAIRLLRQRGR